MELPGPSNRPKFGQFTGGRYRPVMGVIEITSRCNMNCPICFADCGSMGDDLPLSEIERRLDQLKRVCGGPIPLQISGGEPTLREDLGDIVRMSRNKGFGHIELITNGIRLADGGVRMRRLKQSGLKAVYLQFDGLKRSTHRRLRGRDMTLIRRHALEAIRAAGLCCTLAVAVSRGVNDDEIGSVVDFAVENCDVVRAVNFQAATRFNGRFDLESGHRGYGLPELLKLVQAQTDIPSDAFVSEHIGGDGCNAMSLVFIQGNRRVPIFQHLDRRTIAEFMGDHPKEKVLALFGGKKDFLMGHLMAPAGRRLLKQVASVFDHNPLHLLKYRHILLFAKSFMECSQMDRRRIDHCCYGISGAEGVFSFCAYNNLYRL